MFWNGLSLQHQKLWNAANTNEPELFAESLGAHRSERQPKAPLSHTS